MNVRKNRTFGKKAACLLLCLALCLLQAGIASAAETRTVWSWQFEIQDDNTAKIIAYRGADTELIIPEELEKAVSAIPEVKECLVFKKDEKLAVRIYAGTPEKLLKCKESYTAKYLKL